MRIDIMTLFPEFFSSPLEMSILSRAREKELVSYHMHNIREYGKGKRRQVDSSPYGGGPGLVMMPDVLLSCYESIAGHENAETVYLSPRGEKFTQKIALDIAENCSQLILIAGHYEGVDQRALKLTGAKEISVGDYVLSGGETAALSVIDSVVRLVPGVLGNEDSVKSETFSRGLLEHDHYTYPRKFRGLKVPKVLLNGNHARIEKWRLKNSLQRTVKHRPDMMSEISPEIFEDIDK